MHWYAAGPGPLPEHNVTFEWSLTLLTSIVNGPLKVKAWTWQYVRALWFLDVLFQSRCSGIGIEHQCTTGSYGGLYGKIHAGGSPFGLSGFRVIMYWLVNVSTYILYDKFKAAKWVIQILCNAKGNTPEPVAYQCTIPKPLRRHWNSASEHHRPRNFVA